MKTHTLLLTTALALAGVASSLAATITWDGGGGDLSWQNPLNWSGDQVPGPADDAVINVPANVTIVSVGSVTIRSVQCQGGLRVSGGGWAYFTVTAGSSFINGTFTLPAGQNLSAYGSGVVFTARGPTVILGGTLTSCWDAAIVLTNVTSLVLTDGNLGISAGTYGAGLVDLSQVTNVVVGPGGSLAVSISSGSRVDLSRARITGSSVSVYANGAGSVVDLSGLSGEWGASSIGTPSTLSASDGGAVLIPNVTSLTNVSLVLNGTNGTPISQLRSIRQGNLNVQSFAPDFSSLTNVDGTSLNADLGATLNLNKVTEGGFRQAYANRGAVVRLTNLTTLIVTNWTTYLRAGAECCGGLVDLSRVTNVVVRAPGQLNVGAYYGARVDLQRVESITGYSTDVLSDGAGSVIDLSRLSGFLTPQGASSLKAQNGGVILINSNAVFLLANVAVTLPGLIVQATPAMVLHALPWHSYWVEQRDTRLADSPWQFVARVPMTSTFQTFAPAPPPNTAFRVWEFVADPPILDLWPAGAEQTQLVLYGATNKNYAVQCTNALPETAGDWPVLATASMTNSFRLFAPAAATEAQRFYRAREL